MPRFISWIIARIDARASWSELSKLRNSFISKAVTAFSLATFVLGNFSTALRHLGIDSWRLKLMFCGSALVLIGYAVVSVRMPSEFKLTYNLDEIAYRMSTFGDYNFFVSRRTMMKNLLARLESSRHSDSVNGPIQYAKIQLSSAAGKREADWEGSARSLYHSDITLRQFDRVKGRMIALTLLATGIACLLVPTVIGVLQVLFGFLD